MADEDKKTEENEDEKEEKKDVKEASKEPQPVPKEQEGDTEKPQDEITSLESKEEVPEEGITKPVEKSKEKIEVAEKEQEEVVPEEGVEPLEEQEKTGVEEVKAKEEVSEESIEPEKGEVPIEAEALKEEKKPEKKKDEKKGDFKYIVRIANTDVDGDRTVVMGLSQIKGIGRHMAVLITDAAGINRTTKVGDLKDPQIDRIRDVLADLPKVAPGWMLNHRKDLDTGDDIHLISSEVELDLRDDINLLKMIRSYRGIRHETGLRVRGQRTRANNRRGLALGVSKKRE